MIDKMIMEICNNFYSRGEYEDLPETIEISGKPTDLFFKDERFADIRYELEELIAQSESAFEKQGFYYGFKCAMEIFEREVKSL